MSTHVAEFNDPRLVAIYDAVNSYEEGTQPDFYTRLAGDLGVRSVLDFGCGTGIITCELARLGYKVTGVDPSALMIGTAAKRPYCDQVAWICADAESLPPLQADLAIMSGHVAQFFLSDSDWALALSALHEALRDGGWLAFESRDPRRREWESWTRSNFFTVHDANQGLVDTWCELDDMSGDVASCTNHYLFHRTGEELISRARLRFRSLEELTQSLIGAGFAVEDVFGYWDRRPAGPENRELVFVASR